MKPKTARLELRADDDELARWTAAAAELGLTRGAWLRLVANQASRMHGVKQRVAKAAKLAQQAQGLGIDPLILWGGAFVRAAKQRGKKR